MQTLVLFLCGLFVFVENAVPFSEQNAAFGYIKNIGIPLAEKIRKAEESSRIIGGVPAALGQYPYQVRSKTLTVYQRQLFLLHCITMYRLHYSLEVLTNFEAMSGYTLSSCVLTMYLHIVSKITLCRGFWSNEADELFFVK